MANGQDPASGVVDTALRVRQLLQAQQQMEAQRQASQMQQILQLGQSARTVADPEQRRALMEVAVQRGLMGPETADAYVSGFAPTEEAVRAQEAVTGLGAMPEEERAAVQRTAGTGVGAGRMPEEMAQGRLAEMLIQDQQSILESDPDLRRRLGMGGLIRNVTGQTQTGFEVDVAGSQESNENIRRAARINLGVELDEQSANQFLLQGQRFNLDRTLAAHSMNMDERRMDLMERQAQQAAQNVMGGIASELDISTLMGQYAELRNLLIREMDDMPDELVQSTAESLNQYGILLGMAGVPSVPRPMTEDPDRLRRGTFEWVPGVSGPGASTNTWEQYMRQKGLVGEPTEQGRDLRPTRENAPPPNLRPSGSQFLVNPGG